MSTDEAKKRQSPENEEFLKSTKVLVDKAAQLVPEALRPTVLALSPYLARAWITFLKYAPLLYTGIECAMEVYHSLPHVFLQMIYGLALCFFGVHFSLTIAAIEALRISGWDSLSTNIRALWNDCNAVYAAYEEDTLKNPEDIKNLTANELIQRKAVVVARAVDPHKINDSVHALYVGLAAVVTTVQMKTLKSMALGSSIADQMKKWAGKYILPTLKKLLTQYEMKEEWAPIIVSYALKSVTVTFAWYYMSIVSMGHSAIYGGRLFVLSAIKYGNDSGLMEKYFGKKFDPETSDLDEIAGWTLSGLGVYFQLRNYLSLPFLLYVLFFPLSITESVLGWLVIWQPTV